MSDCNNFSYKIESASDTSYLLHCHESVHTVNRETWLICIYVYIERGRDFTSPRFSDPCYLLDNGTVLAHIDPAPAFAITVG